MTDAPATPPTVPTCLPVRHRTDHVERPSYGTVARATGRPVGAGAGTAPTARVSPVPA